MTETTQALIRCRIKPDHVARHLELLEAVHAELQALRPEGLRYVSYRLADGVTFVELVEGGGQGRLAGLAAFRAYRSTLPERVEEGPDLEDLIEVGSYGFG